jgi:hypothetical protein
MNYNKLNYELIVENDLTTCLAAQMDIRYLKHLPALSIKKAKDFQSHEGYEAAFAALRQQSYLKKGVSHSAYETQSLQFVETEVRPLTEAMTYSLMTKFELAFRNGMTQRKSTNIFVITRIASIFSDTLKLYKADFNKPRVQDCKHRLDKALGEWKLRLDVNDFNGGKTPDLADFYVSAMQMFSCLTSPEFITRPVVSKNWRVAFWLEKMKEVTEQTKIE